MEFSSHIKTVYDLFKDKLDKSKVQWIPLSITFSSTLSIKCCLLNFSSVGGVSINCDVLFSPFSLSWVSTSISCEAKPLSMDGKVGGVTPYNIAADDGLVAVLPLLFGLLITLALALTSIEGLGIDTLGEGDAEGPWGEPDESADDGLPSFASRFLRT